MMNPYYQDEAVTIYHGDNREVLPLVQSCDIGITDPQYGVKMDKGFEGFEGFGGFGTPIARRRYEEGDWDAERPTKAVFDALLASTETCLIFGGDFFADLLPQGKHWIVWDKLNTMPSFGDCELIWTNVERNSIKKIRYEYNGLIGREPNRAHPTQKPLGLLKQLVWDYTKQGDIILDPWMGSGTTLDAAKTLRRRAIGIEREERYCEIAAKRMSQSVLDFTPADGAGRGDLDLTPQGLFAS